MRSTIDAATAVMGCAPAYLARAVEALIEAGVRAGLDPDLSDMLVREAAAGTGEHLLSREPREMQVAIASPGGSTEAGLEALGGRGRARRLRGRRRGLARAHGGGALMPALAAIDRGDVASFVDNLFLVYIILIIASIVISWVVTFRGSLPYSRPLRAVTDFIDEVGQPLSERLPPAAAADRRRRDGARPEPDDRPDPAAAGAGHHRRADRG